MSFSAATCITEVGPQPLGENIEIYSDVDNYTVLVSAVTLTQLTTNCPLILEVPDGSTKLKVFDPETTCFYIIQLQSNNMCAVCDLGFTSFNSSSTSRLTVGDLTGSCESSITDYLINWYVDDDLIFTSGKGTLFTYEQTHPMTGTSSLLVTEGLYTPVIQNVELNGFIFSKTGGTGNIPANLTCFDGQSVFVTGFTCDNGDSSDLPQYEHKILFQGKSSDGVIPPTASASYKLSADTKFFAWGFQGETISDTLKLSLVSSNYPTPIILEYWTLGSNAGYNTNVNSFPKKFNTSGQFRKVTTLTGMTISPGDYIQIDITPNSANTQTNWTLYMDCISDFTCEVCNQQPDSYKISGSTITGITSTCSMYVKFDVIGECSPYNGYETLDIYKYFNTSNFDRLYVGYTNESTNSLYWTAYSCGRNSYYSGNEAVCSTHSGFPITYEKTPGNFKITTQSINDLTFFKNNYDTAVLPYLTPFSADSTNLNYYRYFAISWPSTTGNANCGDGTSEYKLFIHISSIVTTGQTGSDYYINFTMPTVTNSLSFPACNTGCYQVPDDFGVTGNINQYSSNTFYNYLGTTNKGAKYTSPIYRTYYYTTGNTSSTNTTETSVGYVRDLQNGTYPATATTSNPPVYTVVYNLSGQTCTNSFWNSNFFSWDPASDSSYLNYAYHYTYYYSIKLIDPSDLSAFSISTYPISSNGNPNTVATPIDVYIFSGGTVQYTNPTYII